MLEKVPDKVFSTKMMGEGLAFQFAGSDIYAPCDGTVVMIAQTKHAIGFKTSDGIEILLHVGLEVANLNGKGINILTQLNMKVSHGQKIMSIDREIMAENNINLITPLVITNSNGMNVKLCDEGDVTLDTIVGEVSKE